MSSYIGMNAATGRTVTGIEHLQQSVADILTTPIGSVLTLREYGSYNMALIDQPMTPALRLQIIAASMMALLRWEPRARPANVSLSMGQSASAWVMDLTLVMQEGPLAGQTVAFTMPLTGARA